MALGNLLCTRGMADLVIRKLDTTKEQFSFFSGFNIHAHITAHAFFHTPVYTQTFTHKTLGKYTEWKPGLVESIFTA